MFSRIGIRASQIQLGKYYNAQKFEIRVGISKAVVLDVIWSKRAVFAPYLNPPSNVVYS